LVVPVKSPPTRSARRFACGLSPAGKNPGPTWCPIVWLKISFAGLFSWLGDARTQWAHRAPDGGCAPGGSVRKWTGAAAAGSVPGTRDVGGAQYTITAAAPVISTAAPTSQACPALSTIGLTAVSLST
jgi:hypothetical protein